MEDAAGELIGMAAIQRADVEPHARLAAAMLWSALRDARDNTAHGRHARRWLIEHGADWLNLIVDDLDPEPLLARLLADEEWFTAEAPTLLDARPPSVAR